MPLDIQQRLDSVREQMEADRAVLRERMARQHEEYAARVAAEREAGYAKARADR